MAPVLHNQPRGSRPWATVRRAGIDRGRAGRMQTEAKATRQESNAYELFILVVAGRALVFMAGLVLPRLDPATESLLRAYDNAICLVFLIDFGLRLRRASSKRGSLVGGGGGRDPLGAVPGVRG